MDHASRGRSPSGCARSSSRAAALALAILLAAPSAGAQSPYFARPDLQPAVDALDVVDLDGRRWTAAALRERVVLLDFWATWCAPCLAQMPELRALRRQFGARGFEILAISVNSSTRRDVIAWLRRQGIAWPQVHDGRAFNGTAARAFGLQALPASVLLRDGQIVAANLRGAALEAAIRRELDAQRTSTSSFEAARVPIVIR